MTSHNVLLVLFHVVTPPPVRLHLQNRTFSFDRLQVLREEVFGHVGRPRTGVFQPVTVEIIS